MATLPHSRNYIVLVLLGQRLAGGQYKVNLLEEISLADVIPHGRHFEKVGIGSIGCQLLLMLVGFPVASLLFRDADAEEEVGNKRWRGATVTLFGCISQRGWV